MKAINRKLLSLLLAMAMILTLAPTALAAGETVTVNPSDPTPGSTVSLGLQGVSIPNDATGISYAWQCGSENLASTGATATYSVPAGTSAGTTLSFTCTIKYTPVVTEGTPSPSEVTITATGSATVKATDTTVPVTGVTIAQGSSVSGTAGSTVQLSATVAPANATTQGVVWSSGDKSKATVSTTGLVSIAAGATGSVAITATSKGTNAQGSTESATCTVTIQPASVTPTITLTPASSTVQMGSTLSLTVVPTNAPAGATVAFELSDATMGSVTGSTSPYTFTPSKTGSVTITAKLMQGTTELAKSSEATITVTPAATGATLSTNSTSISVGGIANLTVKTTGLTANTDYNYISWTVSQNGAIVSVPSTTNALTNTATGLVAGSATITANLMKNGVTAPVATTNSVTVQVVNNAVTISTVSGGTAISKYDLAGYGSNVRLYANVANSNNTIYYYTWSTTAGGSNIITLDYTSNQYVNIQAIGVGQTTLTVTVKDQNGSSVGTASIPITVGQSGLQPSVTVSGYTDYLLSERDSLNQSSVVSQIESMVNNSSGRRLYSVVFSNVDSTYGNLSATRNGTYYADGVTTSTGGRLSDVVFSPRQVGKATFSFYAYYSLNGSVQNNSPLSGVLTIEVKEGVTTGDITYTASIGDDVSFVMGDFEDYYYTKTKGTLSYVSFTLPSGGSLYSDRGRLTTSNACYVSPTSSQADLAGVYFTPTGTTATRASTVRISFTAYGNRTSTSGTVAITYLAGSAKDITYNITTSGTLKASDFTDAYKAVVGSTAPSGLTIQFQSVPTYGTLTYKDSSRTSSSTVTLRSSNIKNYNFTTRTSGSNQLGDVTYTASGTRSDTIEYIAYVNSTPQFTGKVVFNSSNASASNMQIAKTSVSGAAVTFSYADFTTANAVVMASCSYIRVVTLPAGGTLTYNGTAVTLSSTNILPALLGSLVYRPSASFNNSTDRFSFLCYDANGNSVGGGQVSIVVTGNTSNSAGVTTVNQFKDVTATAWYRNDLITLVNAGIIQGRGDGKFDPTAELTYGEALKIFMLASGYPAQAEASGKDWAINYKNLAVSNGWISSSVDLSSKISRNQMAELAARSLGLSSSSASVPWTDGTANGYAVALYYTSPQILIGNADGTFKGTSTLLRQEICAIASRILTYRATQQSVDKPAWLG